MSDKFPSLLQHVQKTFALSFPRKHLFRTSASGLFDTFIQHLPAEWRQHYTCNACRSWFRKYAGLVYIEDNGTMVPAMWMPKGAPKLFKDSIVAVWATVRSARVTGVFLSSDPIWGEPTSGGWTHFAVEPHPDQVFKCPVTTTIEAEMAKKVEERGMLRRALDEYSNDLIVSARDMLLNDGLYRADEVLPAAEFLVSLARSEGLRENLIWLWTARAVGGQAHVKGGMLGYLLEDIKNKVPMAALKARFADKMDPTKRLRPTAVKEGTIRRAEEIVALLNAENALQRRFARVEECELIWRPGTTSASARVRTGAFAHVSPGPVSKGRITLTEFLRVVAPTASKIEVRVPTMAPFVSVVAPVNKSATPIIRWANQYSWYMYDKPCPAEHWNLRRNTFYPVTGISLDPSSWGKESGDKVFLFIAGCRDVNYVRGGGMFPEIMRHDLHEIRSVIERHAATSAIFGKNEGTANGLCFQEGFEWDLAVHARVGDAVHSFIIERW